MSAVLRAGQASRRARLAGRHQRNRRSRWTPTARVIERGAVAIDGRDIVAVDTAAAIASRIPRPRHDRRRRRRRHAGPGQHAHARADGPVPRAGGRPGADGLAAEIHLPGRSQDGVAGVRARRHAAGGARDDRVRHDDLRRHVLLRGRDRARDEGGGAARRARRDDHPVPGAGREDARPKAWRGPERFAKEFAGDDLITAGRRAARDVHARRRHAEGVARARGPAERSQ